MRSFAGIVLCLTALPSFGEPLSAGRNAVDVRGRAQDVYFYPASGTRRGTALFLPGDGGWRGFAIEAASALAAAGFDVYGWDVKQYLSTFTNGRATLSEADIQADTAALAARLGADGQSRRFVLVGWSQGAAMSVLAAAAPKTKTLLEGVIVIGLPESGVLGWRLADNLTYITKRQPDEPKFPTAPWVRTVAPLRFGMIYSTSDEYVSAETAKHLFSMAVEPKRLDLVSAHDHHYGGNRTEFLRVLTDQVTWAGQQRGTE